MRARTPLFLSSLAALLFSLPASAQDLAAPGMGLSDWQWACRAQTPAPIAAFGAAPGPASLSPIEPSSVASTHEADDRVSLRLKRGVTWRGLPVSALALSSAPGSFFYLVIPLPPAEVLSRLTADNPLTPELAERAREAGALPFGMSPPASLESHLLQPEAAAPSERPGSSSVTFLGCFSPEPHASPALRLRAKAPPRA